MKQIPSRKWTAAEEQDSNVTPVLAVIYAGGFGLVPGSESHGPLESLQIVDMVAVKTFIVLNTSIAPEK
ncbi:hypothetical protein DCAR_0934785 [Daucus carota subsp. sativus]|uniref:Uncharacterized protein n=1 Tax=Daucus carota subsp. sativus TaxID=79200 RepID=A0A175YAS6_DAUCS|nr:hypothetical protein DCAR_0934785 [Daucus carota subsp. sativus]